MYGPLFLFLFGVDEETVIESWSMERFERYRNAADQLLEMQMRR